MKAAIVGVLVQGVSKADRIKIELGRVAFGGDDGEAWHANQGRKNILDYGEA